MITFMFSFIALLATLVIHLLFDKNNNKKTYTLSLIYLGASLMWLMDMVFELAEDGLEVFSVSKSELLSESLLGILVVCLGIIVWGVIFFFPKFKVLNRKEC